MKVILEPVTGTPKANLERAKYEMERLLAFRGSVSEVVSTCSQDRVHAQLGGIFRCGLQS
jgi:hypothetical protein